MKVTIDIVNIIICLPGGRENKAEQRYAMKLSVIGCRKF